MAKSSQPDKGNSRKTNKTGRRTDDPQTERLPKLQRAVDAWEASLTDWPDQADNKAAGGDR